MVRPLKNTFLCVSSLRIYNLQYQGLHILVYIDDYIFRIFCLLFEDEGVYIFFFFIILDILHHIFGGRNGGDFKA